MQWCNWWHHQHHMTKPKGPCCTSLWLSGPKKCSGAICGTICIMWYWHWYQCHAAPHFICPDLRNWMVLLVTISCDTNADITWYWCWHQWCHMNRQVILHQVWLSWPKKSSNAIDDAICVLWCQLLSPMASI